MRPSRPAPTGTNTNLFFSAPDILASHFAVVLHSQNQHCTAEMMVKRSALPCVTQVLFMKRGCVIGLCPGGARGGDGSSAVRRESRGSETSARKAALGGAAN